MSSDSDSVDDTGDMGSLSDSDMPAQRGFDEEPN